MIMTWHRINKTNILLLVTFIVDNIKRIHNHPSFDYTIKMLLWAEKKCNIIYSDRFIYTRYICRQGCALKFQWRQLLNNNLKNNSLSDHIWYAIFNRIYIKKNNTLQHCTRFNWGKSYFYKYVFPKHI